MTVSDHHTIRSMSAFISSIRGFNFDSLSMLEFSSLPLVRHPVVSAAVLT